MSSIGFRCWANKFAYVVLDGTLSNPKVVGFDLCTAPVGRSRQQILHWLRTEVHEILDKYKPEAGSFKCTEAVAPKKDMQRGEFEGVIQEACISHSCSLSIESRQKNQLKSALQFTRPARYINDIVASNKAIKKLDNNKFRDATLAALCGL